MLILKIEDLIRSFFIYLNVKESKIFPKCMIALFWMLLYILCANPKTIHERSLILVFFGIETFLEWLELINYDKLICRICTVITIKN